MIHYLLLSIFIYFCFFSPETNAKNIEQVLVTSKRLNNSFSEDVYGTSKFNKTDLNRYSLALDDTLRRNPGFSLYRRQVSRASHPTIQGANLRGLGPNGAGRTLVILDGIPLNDPFGGWVNWISLPNIFLENVLIQNAGGSGPWGNRSLSGVIRLDSRETIKDSFEMDIRYGAKDTSQTDIVFSSGHNINFFGGLSLFNTNGFISLSPEQRGIADLPLKRQGETFKLGLSLDTDLGVKFFITSQFSSDDFTNGSLLAGSESQDYQVTFSALKNDLSDSFNWESHFYYRLKEFQNIFESFNSARTLTKPVLEQFDVPSDVIGGNLKLRWSRSSEYILESGVDFQIISGSTNEKYRNLGSGFTRVRNAGGKQFLLGTYFESNYKSSDDHIYNFGLRLDYWSQSNGYRKESNLINDNILIDTQYQNKDGISLNGRAGALIRLSDYTDLNFSLYSSVRTPTLNELYRPFRVKNDITEANSSLKNERMAGAEISFSFDLKNIYLQSTLFRNDLFDPVLNVTISEKVGFNSNFNVFIPRNGSLRQRNNISHVKNIGFESDFIFYISENLEFNANYLFTNPKISKSNIFKDLRGNRLAQVSKHQGNLSLEYNYKDFLKTSVDLLYTGKQFEDDANIRKLKKANTINIFSEYSITEKSIIYISFENLLNKRTEVGVTKEGLISLGPPRFFWVGIRLKS